MGQPPHVQGSGDAASEDGVVVEETALCMSRDGSATGSHGVPSATKAEEEDATLCIASDAAASRVPPATKAETTAWKYIDVANSVYSLVGIGGMLPLLVQAAALAASGFPGACPNVVTDAGAIAGVFGAKSGVAAMHRLADAAPEASEACADAGALPRCLGAWCQGYPRTVAECRAADGGALWMLRTGGESGVDPTSYATTSITLSVAAQALVFVAIGAMADYGPMRKRVLMQASWIGAAICIACLGVTPGTWWLGMPLMVVSNAAFGLTSMAYNAYLPLLVAALPEVAAETDPTARAALSSLRSSELSSQGFAWGFAAGVAGLLLCVPWSLLLSEISGYQAAMVVTGIWWAAFMWWQPRTKLLERPGPPLPPGTSYISQSLRSVKLLISRLRVLPVTSRYLLLWMLYSDGVFAIGTLGALYANAEVEWGCIPKAGGILLMFLLVPLFAWGGNLAYLRALRRHGVSPQRLLVGSLVAVGLVPLYGLVGYFSATLGLRQGWELILVCAWYGFHMGAMQAFARSLFVPLIPPGQESSYFSAFELSNKGSSWLCPLVMTLVQAATGDLRASFLFVLLNIWGPAFFLAKLDIEGGRVAAEALAATAAAAAGVSDKSSSGSRRVAASNEPPELSDRASLMTSVAREGGGEVDTETLTQGGLPGATA